MVFTELTFSSLSLDMLNHSKYYCCFKHYDHV